MYGISVGKVSKIVKNGNVDGAFILGFLVDESVNNGKETVNQRIAVSGIGERFVGVGENILPGIDVSIHGESFVEYYNKKDGTPSSILKIVADRIFIGKQASNNPGPPPE
jgi:hypothetical protein